MCVGACSGLSDLSESMSGELGTYKIDGSSPGSVVWLEGSDVSETGSECSSDVGWLSMSEPLWRRSPVLSVCVRSGAKLKYALPLRGFGGGA